MSFKEYFYEENENKQENEDKVMGAILDFFASHESPSDDEVHNLAKELGIDKHQFEEKIYAILSSFFNAGRHKEKPLKEIDEDQLQRGIKVEMEHTNIPAIARKISLDHMSEFPGKDYYKYLKDMEDKLR